MTVWPRFKGVGEAVICELKIVEAAAQRLARARVMQRPVVSSWDDLLDYCHTTMAHRDIEQFRVLYLDRKNVLIADEEQARGTVDHVPVYPREVVKRALQLNASALILVHNHPSGDPTPSPDDIAMTRQVSDAAAQRPELITLHDHLIIGNRAAPSGRAQLPCRRPALNRSAARLSHPDFDPPVDLTPPGAVIAGHRHRLAKARRSRSSDVSRLAVSAASMTASRTASGRGAPRWPCCPQPARRRR